MDFTAILVVAALFLLYALFSKRLANTSLTAPMIFTGAGLIIAFFSKDFLGTSDMSQGTVHILAEITLVLVLFTDASHINLKSLTKDHILPQRMLSIGMPLTVLFGTLVAFGLFYETFTIWEAALIAAILTPTDAALGQAVVSSEKVPVRIRQTLSVESGLNDGIALPLVLLLASVASSASSELGSLYWAKFALLQVTLGPLIGIIVGFVGAKLIGFVVKKDWMSQTFEGVFALSIAFIAFAGAEFVHGNGFIAAFVAGLTFGNVLTNSCKFLYEFAESEGQFFTLATFLIFGTVAVFLIGSDFQWIYTLYGVLSLTIIRMLPIAFSLIGTGVNKWTVLFLGWFGPRGLASILFALLILEGAKIEKGEQITSVVIITILLSIALHGITAAPLSRKYGSIIKEDSESEEMKPVPEMMP